MTDAVVHSPGNAFGLDLMSTLTATINAHVDWIQPAGSFLVADRLANTGKYSGLATTEIEPATFEALPSQSTGLNLDFDPGEAIVGGTAVVTDETKTAALPSNATDEPVFLGWNTMSNDAIAIGPASDFTDDWQTTELYQVDTDDTTVTSITDTRPIGQEDARPRVAEQSDIVLRRVSSFPTGAQPSDNEWYVVGNDRRVMRPTPDGFREVIQWRKEGATIEDWEDSGGNIPPEWTFGANHTITAAADLEGGSWGFSTNGTSGRSYSDAGLEAYPTPDAWFDGILQWDDIPTDGCVQTVEFARSNVTNGVADDRYQLFINLNGDGTFNSIRVDEFEGGNSQGAITPYNGTPGEPVSTGTPYRFAIYWASGGGTWHLEWSEYNQGGSDRLINSWTGTASVIHTGGGIALNEYAYGTELKADLLRRPPRNPP